MYLKKGEKIVTLRSHLLNNSAIETALQCGVGRSTIYKALQGEIDGEREAVNLIIDKDIFINFAFIQPQYIPMFGFKKDFKRNKDDGRLYYLQDLRQ